MQRSEVQTHLLQGLEVDFHPGQHKYFEGGTEIQGVTRSAGMTKDTGFLAPWGAKAGAEEADKIFKAKKTDELKRLEYSERIRNAWRKVQQSGADYGNVAHDYLEAWGLSQLGKAPKPPAPVNREVKKTVKPFLKWAKDNKIELIATEQVVLYIGDGHRYAGTLDLQFRIDGKNAIGDYKTGTRVGIDAVWQMAMYANAFEQCFPDQPKIDSLFIFHLPKKNGRKNMKVIELTREDFDWRYAPALGAIKAQEFQIKRSMK